MRGKPKLTFPAFYLPGITPADAGKTFQQQIFSCLLRDHPRGCGENFSIVSCPKYGKGSPPRMRGKLSQSPRDAELNRITPADAGKTAIKTF